jgi:hypothetical protein
MLKLELKSKEISAASNTSSTKTLLLSLDLEFVHHFDKHTENARILNMSCPNILLSTLFLNTLRLRYSLSVSEQVSHPYKTTGKTILLCILCVIFIFLDSSVES